MSYVDTVLMANEKIIYRTKPHWIIFSPAFVWLICAILLVALGGYFPDLRLHLRLPLPPHIIVSIFCVFIAFYYTLGSYIRYISSDFAITNQRIIMKVGLIRRIIVEILLQKIESVKVDQTVLGRIIGYGTIIISGIGGSQDPFNTIPSPLKFHEIVQQQIEKVTPGAAE